MGPWRSTGSVRGHRAGEHSEGNFFGVSKQSNSTRVRRPAWRASRNQGGCTGGSLQSDHGAAKHTRALPVGASWMARNFNGVRIESAVSNAAEFLSHSARIGVVTSLAGLGIQEFNI